MSLKLKRVLALLVIIALVFGWYVTLFGIGDKTKDGAVTSVKSALKYGLDIDGGVYVVMEAKTDLTGDELKKLMEQTRAVLDNRVNQMGVGILRHDRRHQPSESGNSGHGGRGRRHQGDR